MVKAKEDDLRHLVDLKHRVHQAQTPTDLVRAQHELQAAVKQNGDLNAMRQAMKDGRAEYERAHPEAVQVRDTPEAAERLAERAENSTKGDFDPRRARGHRP